MEFLSSEVVLCYCKYTFCSCMECCFHVRAGAVNCNVHILDKLQKRVCGTVGSTVAVSVESLVQLRDEASLKVFSTGIFVVDVSY